MASHDPLNVLEFEAVAREQMDPVAFDYYAGEQARGPEWLRNTGHEWAARLIANPGRLWRRYVLGNPQFLWRAWRAGKEKNYG